MSKHRRLVSMNYISTILSVAGVLCSVIFSGVPVAYAAVHFMGADGSTISTLNVADDGQNKGKIVVDANGKETPLGGGGSCGTLCSLLTVDVKDGKAVIGAGVPDIIVGDAKARLKVIFTDTLNASAMQLQMATPELATASVGKMLGIVSANGINAVIGLTDTKDQRTDVLVSDVNKAKSDIESLKAQLAAVQAALAVQTKDSKACRSETIPVGVDKAVGSGDWVVTPQMIIPSPMPKPPIMKTYPIQV